MASHGNHSAQRVGWAFLFPIFCMYIDILVYLPLHRRDRDIQPAARDFPCSFHYHRLAGRLYGNGDVGCCTGGRWPVDFPARSVDG